jgi:hypothetical protein
MTRLASAGPTGIDLAETWRNAAAFLPHMAGCACAGPHLTLDRDSVEADLLAYLAELYRDAGRVSLARFVAAREDESQPRSSFAAWLASLDRAMLAGQDRECLVADLKTALDSLDAAGAGRSFSCE